MPTTYTEIRASLASGFSVAGLRTLNRLCLTAINEGLPHPSVLFSVAVIAEWIADAWDQKPVLTTTVQRVEQQIRPHLEALLSLETASSDATCSALDHATRAFVACLKATLDSEVANFTGLNDKTSRPM